MVHTSQGRKSSMMGIDAGGWILDSKVLVMEYIHNHTEQNQTRLASI
jgi:hypothetical protein